MPKVQKISNSLATSSLRKKLDDPQFNDVFESFLKTSTLLDYLDESDREEVLSQSELVSIEADEVLCNEGQIPKELYILVQGKLHLFSQSGNEDQIQAGILTPGESLNIYSVVLGLPYQYGSSAIENSLILRIPIHVFQSNFAKVKGLLCYLQQAIESLAFKKIAQEMDEVGIGRHFKVFFLGQTQSVILPPQQLMVVEGVKPTHTFLILEGAVSVHQRQRQALSGMWRARDMVWTSFKDCVDEVESFATFKTSSKVNLLQIDRLLLVEARQKFPSDFDLYLKWVGKLDRTKTDENEDEIEDHRAETLFMESQVRQKPKCWWGYPFVRQNDKMDCGSACLAMISKFWGNEISIQFWRQKLQTNQLGTTVFDLATTAEKFGFITHPVSIKEIVDLDQSLLPAIVLRQNHYLVLYKITSNHVVVGDPSVGIRKMTFVDFNEGYEHAAVLLKPTFDFDKQTSPKSKYAHYISLLAGFKREMAVIFGISILMVVLALIPPFLLQIIFDGVLIKKDYMLLTIVIVAGAFSAISSSVLAYVRSRYITFVASKFDFIASTAFFRKLFSLPYDFVANRHVGDFTRRLAEMERLRVFLTNEVLGIVLDVFTLGIFAVALFFFNPKILFATFLVSGFLVCLSVFFSKRLIRAYQETFTSQAEQDSLVTDTITGFATIKTLHCEITSRWRLEERFANSLNARNKYFRESNALGILSGMVYQISEFTLIGLSAYLALKGELSIGQVISGSVLVSSILGPFNSLAHAWGGIQEAKAVANRLNDIFLAESEKQVTGANGLIKNNFRGEIEFQDVWFRYGGESNNWALKGVSFKVEAGTSVALVGPSGSGKSTIGQLLGGLYKATRGRILIDGRDIGDYDTEWIRRRMGFILQEPCLFHGTIFDNIGVTSPNINEKRVIEVAEIADAMSFILQKPNGLNYMITHGGLGLSGGEKQRIAFARALYSDPQILILDEATSAMDGISERAIIHALRGDKRTMINIAHRFSTAAASDFVIVVDSGVVVGSGSHKYLAQLNPLYRDLFNLSDIEESFQKKVG